MTVKPEWVCGVSYKVYRDPSRFGISYKPDEKTEEKVPFKLGIQRLCKCELSGFVTKYFGDLQVPRNSQEKYLEKVRKKKKKKNLCPSV